MDTFNAFIFTTILCHLCHNIKSHSFTYLFFFSQLIDETNAILVYFNGVFSWFLI